MSSPIADEIVLQILRRHFGTTDANLRSLVVRNVDDRHRTHNFNSEAARFVVAYEVDGVQYSRRFFAKLPARSCAFEMNRKMGVLRNELAVYEYVLPELQRVASKKFAPTLYYAGVAAADCDNADDDYTLILDDLLADGYGAPTPFEQYGLATSVHILRELAEFHAASVRVRRSGRRHVFDRLDNAFLTWTPLMGDADGARMIGDRFMRLVRRIDAAYALQHASQLDAYKNHILGRHYGHRRCNDKPGAFNVLIHGDFWSSNVMLRYDDDNADDVDDAVGKRIADVKFVDFQYCYWNSPAFDVFLFVMSSVKYEVFETRFDALLEAYTSALNEALRRFGCDERTYTGDQLQNDIDDRYDCWIFTLVFFMPLIFSNPKRHKPGRVYDDQLLDDEPYARMADKWMSYFMRKSVESPECKMFRV